MNLMVAQANFNIHDCPITVNAYILHAEYVLYGCKVTKNSTKYQKF